METPATYTDLTFVIDQLNEHGDVEKQKELIAYAPFPNEQCLIAVI